MAKTVLAFSHFVLLVAFAAAAIPPFFDICGRRNPEIDECIKRSVIKLLPKLKEGYPELDIPPLDPLHVDNIHLSDLDTFKASASNVTLRNLSVFTIQHFHLDAENYKIYMEFLFPSIDFHADYDVQAKILVPIVGKGPIEMITDNVTAKVIMQSKTVERRGQKYIFFTAMTTKLHISDYVAKFMPSDGPESTLATAINSVLENSKEELLEATTPNIEKAISKLVLSVSNKISRHFTYDELFPDRE